MNIISLLIFIFILFMLVIIHEAGHFIFAKIMKMRVDEFAFGFPPRLFSKKIGETKYSFNLIPLGGYVKIFGENGIDDSENTKREDRQDRRDMHRSFESKGFWAKLIVLSGGVLFNFIACILLLTLSFLFSKQISLSEDEAAKIALDQRSLIVTSVDIKSNLKSQNINVEDKIISISSNGQTLTGVALTKTSFTDLIQKNTDELMEVKLLDNKTNKEKIVSAVPQAGIVDGKKVLGLSVLDVAYTKLGFLEAIQKAYSFTMYQTKFIFTELYKLIINSFNGTANIKDSLAGPIGLASATRDIGERSVSTVLAFAAMLSLSLAIFNILPIPALDGGRILFIFVDELSKKILKKKIPHTAEKLFHTSGFILLMILFVFVTYSDIAKLF